ncbi:MAG: DUF1343 domain-containing protein [Acidobacteriia bacterium]|nr:DUF1343 domain-containing protein [Terriglobia bacterium]
MKTGIEALIEQNFAPLKGKRVGVITAQTGVTEDGRRIIDVLAQAPEVKLTAIFAPEHGVDGTRDDRNVADSVDRTTGVPIFSLYNEGRYRPTAEMLKDVDALVFDIQQNGARFLTRFLRVLPGRADPAGCRELPCRIPAAVPALVPLPPHLGFVS